MVLCVDVQGIVVGFVFGFIAVAMVFVLLAGMGVIGGTETVTTTLYTTVPSPYPVTSTVIMPVTHTERVTVTTTYTMTETKISTTMIPVTVTETKTATVTTTSISRTTDTITLTTWATTTVHPMEYYGRLIHYEGEVLAPDEAIYAVYYLSEGDLLHVKLESNPPVKLVILDFVEYTQWLLEDDYKPVMLVNATGSIDSYTIIPYDDFYVVIVYNHNVINATVTVIIDKLERKQ